MTRVWLYALAVALVVANTGGAPVELLFGQSVFQA